MNQSWNSEKYTDDFSFVYNYGSDVANLFDWEKINSMLDLGCGSGELTESFFKTCK